MFCLSAHHSVLSCLVPLAHAPPAHRRLTPGSFHAGVVALGDVASKDVQPRATEAWLDAVAVQAHLVLADYLSGDAFARKIFSYSTAVSAAFATDGGARAPRLVVFPEDVAMFLVAVGCERELRGCLHTDVAFARIGRKLLPRILWSMLRFCTLNPTTAFWLCTAVGASAVRA